MTKRIRRSIIVVALASLILAVALIFIVVHGFFRTKMEERLSEATNYIAQSMNRVSDQTAYLHSLPHNNSRITWVGRDGNVLFDSWHETGEMDNHLDRPEIRDALLKGEGTSRRYSATLSESTAYHALRLDDGTVLRLSDTQISAWGLAWGMFSPIAWIAIGLIIASAVIAGMVSRRIVRPINMLDLKRPEGNDAYDEIAPLLTRMAVQNRTIRGQIELIRERQNEFETIVDNMSEGLAVLDENGKILSINDSAKNVFPANAGNYEGEYILTLNRDEQILRLVEKAQKGEMDDTEIEVGDRVYTVYANPVFSGENVNGMIILTVDSTDKFIAEQSRREFSANVSHELKTPLTSIIGYADIMRAGLLPETKDIPEFAGRIYEEANRLRSLVDDILRLSQMDEGQVGTDKENVDILPMLRDIVARLRSEAETKQIHISVEGQELMVYGVKPVLDEVFYNLISNAIQYNKPGGEVVVSATAGEGRACISVSDTGIGIPAGHVDKVFERFYRVDKSHSKETGGTGLGLAIVKHGVGLHGGEVRLESEEQAGTTVQVVLPLG